MDDLKHARDIAKKLPSKIRVRVLFSDKSLIGLVICSLVLLLLLGGYIFDGRQKEWIVLSIIAVIIALIAFFKALDQLAQIEIENSLVTIIRKQGGDYVDNDGDRDELDVLFSRLSIENESQPATNRLIKHIIGEAKINKFDTGVNLIQPYKDESLDIIFSLQNYQKIALWIGIGGTFIGILKAMHESDFKKILESGNANDFVKVIPLMFDGLVVSFSASLAGLFSAVIIGFLILIIRNKQKEYFQQIESVVNILLASAMKSKNRGKFLTEIDLLRNDLNNSQNITKEMQFSNSQLQELISETQTQIVKQNTQVQESVDKFLETNKRIYEVAEKTEQEVKNSNNTVLLKDALLQSIEIASKRMSESISKSISEQVSMMTGQMIRFNETAEKFNTSVQFHNQLVKNTSEMTGQIIRFNETAEKFNTSVQFHNQLVKNTSEQGVKLNKAINTSLINVASSIKNLKLPQNLAIWVVILTLLLGIIIGGFSVFGVSFFLSEPNRNNTNNAIDSTSSANSNATNKVVINNANKVTNTSVNIAINK